MNGDDSTDRRRSGICSTAIGLLRGDPRLLVPFFVVGAFLTLVDQLRVRDPIRAIERRGIATDGVHVELEFSGYPTGVTQTTLPLESLIGLRTPYLVWGLGAYLLPLVAIGAAGAITMSRAGNGRAGTELPALLRYLGYVLAADLLYRLFTSIDFLQGMGLWGIPLLVLFLFVLVRLFAVPGLLVVGRDLESAIRESAHRTRGHGWSVFGVILLVGLGAWLLASVPVLGTLLSTAIVAPLHAVAIVAFLDLGPKAFGST